jgi:hypothetical protein
MILLQTERLILRPFLEDDLDDTCALLDDPDVTRFLSGGRPRSREEPAEKLHRTWSTGDSTASASSPCSTGRTGGSRGTAASLICTEWPMPNWPIAWRLDAGAAGWRPWRSGRCCGTPCGESAALAFRGSVVQLPVGFGWLFPQPRFWVNALGTVLRMVFSLAACP